MFHIVADVADSLYINVAPQHLEQTPGFDASKVLVLVLDEADRILV